MTAAYYQLNFDNEASGPFVAEDDGNLLTWSGGTGFIVTLISNVGTIGKMSIALVSGTPPAENDVITQATTTADVNESLAPTGAKLMLYPAYFRDDLTVPATGICAWVGLALGATHSFFFDAQTQDAIVGEILTFSGGAECEVITLIEQAGAEGEFAVRFITPLDTQGLPADNETFTGDTAADGTLNGVVHDRAYRGLHLHRLLSDLNDDEFFAGVDVLSIIHPTPSARSTDKIVELKSNIVIDDEIAQHMYDASIVQASGFVKYGGLNLQVTSPLASTQPVLIQNDAIITDYWKNAYMPDSIAGNIRIMLKIRDDNVDIDGRRVKGKLLEFGEIYFEGGTTLGDATTSLALFSSGDGNNNTSVGTVAGAPYNTIIITEGFQTIDYNNGNGPTEYGFSVDFGSADSLETWERMKYEQRRGTAELFFGRNAQLATGINRNFPYDGGSGTFVEDEILAWGYECPYTGQSINFTIGEVVTFSGGGSGRILYLDDGGATGTIIVDLNRELPIPLTAETITGVDSGGDGTVGTPVDNSNAGTGLLIGLDDGGATGALYYQGLTGLDPVDSQTVYGSTSNAVANVNQASGASFRTINNQFMGIFTGTNFQTNFGIGIDTTDSILNDINLNLAGVGQGPPNNQQGKVTGVAGDYVTVYPFDGSTFDVNGDAEPNFNEMLVVAPALTGASSEIVVGAIPDNAPASGFLRVERDADNELLLVEYSSHDEIDTFTLVGTFPEAAAIGNTVMRALLDETMTTTQSAYTAKFGSSEQVAVTLKRGGGAAIVPGKVNPTFGATGFDVAPGRVSDI